MATLENKIELSDGVTPILNKVVQGIEALVARFESIGTGTERMSQAVHGAMTNFAARFQAAAVTADTAANGIASFAAATQNIQSGLTSEVVREMTAVNQLASQVAAGVEGVGAAAAIAANKVVDLAMDLKQIHVPNEAAVVMQSIGEAASLAGTLLAEETVKTNNATLAVNALEQGFSGVGTAATAAAAHTSKLSNVCATIRMPSDAVQSIQEVGVAANLSSARMVKLGVAAQVASEQLEDVGEKLKQALDGGSQGAGNLNEKLKQTPGILASIKEGFSSAFAQFTMANLAAGAIQKVVSLIAQAPGYLAGLSDEYSGIMARINLVTGSQEEAAALNDRIYSAAQRARGGYAEMADAVSKISLTAKEAFPDPQEVVPFMENVQKLFKIGGTDAVRQKDALLQLTQALGSGRLQGDEFRSIAEAAPMIEQVVAQYMGVSQGALKELSSKGEITAEVIKNAILGATGEINTKFDSIPKKWEDISQYIRNVSFRAFTPVFEQMRELANAPGIESFSKGIAGSMVLAAWAIKGVINNMRWLGGVIAANSDVIVPVLWGMVGALVAYNAESLVSLARTGADMFMKGAHALVTQAQMFALVGLTIAQQGLNAALAMCPLSWILYGIIGLIVVLYLAVAAVNRFAGTSYSATGFIAAAFAMLFVFLWNSVAYTWNVFAALAEFLFNVWRHPLLATQRLFYNIWNNIVNFVGEALDEIVGMIKQVPFLKDLVGDFTSASLKLTMPDVPDDYSVVGKMDMKGYGDYGKIYYDKGTNFLENLIPGLSGDSTPEDYGNNVKKYEDVAASGKAIADNTGAMREAMDVTEEDMKYMRDIAEQEAINKYTAAEIKIDMGGVYNSVSNEMDLDGVARHLQERIFEGMSAGAEAVHS